MYKRIQQFMILSNLDCLSNKNNNADDKVQ